MKKDNLKYYIGIGLMILVGTLQIIFFNNNDKYNVYFFYDKERFLTNILYDISVLFDTTILTYWLIKFKRGIFRPLFIVTLASWVTYFLFYNQMASLILIPLYIWLAYRQKQ